MARAIFDNITLSQAHTLASWFEGQGEQDCEVWFEAHDVESPKADEITEKETDVIIICK